jgi:tRNA threonylcarbamoyladenosine biosynthesis protein TsaB
LARGEAVAAHELLPLYVRDKVALTTAERDALKARAQGSASAPVPSAEQEVSP